VKTLLSGKNDVQHARVVWRKNHSYRMIDWESKWHLHTVEYGFVRSEVRWHRYGMTIGFVNEMRPGYFTPGLGDRDGELAVGETWITRWKLEGDRMGKMDDMSACRNIWLLISLSYGFKTVRSLNIKIVDYARKDS
jgi:hypothetical protein